MDNLALSVSKSITDFLEQNEKRYATQNTTQERHDQLLTDLQMKVDQLEKKCDNLTTENSDLKTELETLKQKDECTTKDIILTKSDLERMQKDVKDCNEWMNLMAELTQQVQDLKIVRDLTKKQMEEMSKNQSKLVKRLDDMAQNQNNLVKQINRQQRQIETNAKAAAAAAAAATSSPTPNPNAPHYNIINRAPIRSPSTSSFFNSNMGSHSAMHRYKTSTGSNAPRHLNYLNEDYLGGSDAYDEVCDLSDNAADLVKELNDIHRSFEIGSISSEYSIKR